MEALLTNIRGNIAEIVDKLAGNSPTDITISGEVSITGDVSVIGGPVDVVIT